MILENEILIDSSVAKIYLHNDSNTSKMCRIKGDQEPSKVFEFRQLVQEIVCVIGRVAK